MGCAATPKPTKRIDVDRSGLYQGQPSVAFATEYPVTSFEEGVSRGQQAESLGKADLALYLYVSALAHEGPRSQAFLRIAKIHLSRGNDQQAARALQLALKDDPQNIAAMEELGLALFRQGQQDHAVPIFKQVTAAQPDRWRSLEALGVLADRSRQHEDAIAYYDQALAVKPGWPSLLNNRGYSHYLSGNMEAALKDLHRAAKIGRLDKAWLNLGMVYARKGLYSAALEAYLQTLSTPAAYYEVGSIALDRSDYAASQRYLELAIKASPLHFPAAQKRLAVVREYASGARAIATAPVPRAPVEPVRAQTAESAETLPLELAVAEEPTSLEQDPTENQARPATDESGVSAAVEEIQIAKATAPGPQEPTEAAPELVKAKTQSAPEPVSDVPPVSEPASEPEEETPSVPSDAVELGTVTEEIERSQTSHVANDVRLPRRPTHYLGARASALPDVSDEVLAQYEPVDLSPPSEEERLVVNASAINVREAAAPSSRVIAYLAKGDVVDVLDRTSEWAYVQFIHRTKSESAAGWVHVDLLQVP